MQCRGTFGWLVLALVVMGMSETLGWWGVA